MLRPDVLFCCSESRSRDEALTRGSKAEAAAWFNSGRPSAPWKRPTTAGVTKCSQAESCLCHLHLWYGRLASFSAVLEQWVNQSSHVHPCLQFALIYGQKITRVNSPPICQLSLRCTGEAFSCYEWSPTDLSVFWRAAMQREAGTSIVSFC